MNARTPEDQEYFRLRAEWLRFKNNVYDADTELPTLAAVLDDVRRLLEERGRLGVVYLDLAGSGQIEAIHGWHAYDQVVHAFALALGGLRTEGLLAERDVLAMLSVRGDKFVLFVGGPRGAALETPALESLSEQIDERLRSRLGPAGSDFPAPLGFHLGHALLFRDPMLRSERAIHRALDDAMYMSLRHRAREDDRRAHWLDAVIRLQQVTTLYQPILDLSDLHVLGHEVFSHASAAGPQDDAEGLFALAERTGRLRDFERLCRRLALASARRHLRTGWKLFLNTSAAALREAQAADAGFLAEVEAQGLSHSDVILEITERIAYGERQGYAEVLRSLKREGFGIAIDDMGAGYASLQSVVEIEPDYLKFDVSLVHNIDRSLIKRSLLETLVELSERIGARVIAEGIEAASELETLRSLGVPLGQGRFLAPPQPVPSEAA